MEASTQTAGSAGDDRSQTDDAREQAQQVAGHAGEQAGQVANTARQQAGAVADEARRQAQDLVGEAQEQLRAQASEQTDRAGQAIGGFADRVAALADGRPEDAGPVGDYAEQLAVQAREIAGRIAELGFDGVVEEVQRVARRRPGAFLIGAAVAGFASARLGRGAKEADRPTASERTFEPDTTGGAVTAPPSRSPETGPAIGGEPGGRTVTGGEGGR